MTASDNDAEEVGGLRCSTLRFSAVDNEQFRLDAKYYQQEFILARAQATGCGIPHIPLADLASAFVPGRAKLITVPNPEAGAPYLKAHGAFKTLPDSDRYVASSRMRDYESYLLREGMILTPSSGRNLGPTAYVGASMAKFAMTDIMRVVPRDRGDGFYLLTYLRTAIGQALIRRGRTGTNVDHLAPGEVLGIPVVWPDKGIRDGISAQMERSQALLESARQAIDKAMTTLRNSTGLGGQHDPMGYSSFTASRASLSLRLDAVFYSAEVEVCRNKIARTNCSRLSDVAELVLRGRYKRYYVGEDYGRPILSGTHLLQLRPVNLKSISDRSFSNPEAFVLRKGWSLLTCDGRAEEGLGSVGYVSSLWDGWMASNHVMRAVPRLGMLPGYLYAALCLDEVQAQIKASATGSVIDAIEPDSIGGVLIPRLDKAAEEAISGAVVQAWEDIAESRRLDDEVVGRLEDLIVRAYEGRESAAA